MNLIKLKQRCKNYFKGEKKDTLSSDADLDTIRRFVIYKMALLDRSEVLIP